MSEWKSFCLGDVCNICSSKRIFAREYTKQGIPFYRGKEIIEKHNKNKVSNTLYISEKRYLEVKSKYDVPKIGDILLTSVGTLGIAWFIDESNFYFKDGNLTWLRASDLIDSKFLYWWLNSKEAQEQIERKCIGTTQKALTIETLNKFTIFLPPLDTQKKISVVLSALDDKIELNNAINKNLEEQAQAIYKHMFVDNCNSSWRSGTLSDIAEITMGQSPSGKSYNDTGKGMIFFQGRTDFGFRFPTIRMFTTEPKRIAKKGDVLFSVRAPVGDYNVAVDNCCIGRGLAALFAKNNHQSFLFYTMFYLRKQLEIYNGQGTVFGAINQQELKKIEIVIPEQSLISEFEKIVAPMDSIILNNHLENKKLGELRDALLPRLMSGEIDVSAVEILRRLKI